MKIKKLTCLFFGMLFFLAIGVGCKKDKTDTIPTTPVNFYIEPNSTMYLQLNIPGGWLYLTGGTRGILVYRITNDEFRAFDRACPNEPTNTNAYIKVESSNTTAIDSLCGSRFVLLDGSVIKGPATRGLLQYNAVYDGQYLHIYN
jgi:hypothetical protein